MRHYPVFLRQAGPLLLVMYLGAAGMLCVAAVQLYLGQALEPAAGLVFMGLVFGIYVFNRFTDITEDFSNDIGKYMFFVKRKALYRAAIGAIVLVLVALGAAQKLRAYHVLLIVLGVLYSYRLVPWYSRRRGLIFVRIKQLPLVKNIMVACLWGSAVFAVPMLFAGMPVSGRVDIAILVGIMTVSTFNNTLFCDIRDETGDRIAGNSTVPVLWGTGASYVLMLSITTLWLASAAWITLAGRFGAAHLAFAALMALYPVVYVGYYHLGRGSMVVLDFLCESDLLFFACGLVVLSIVAVP